MRLVIRLQVFVLFLEIYYQISRTWIIGIEFLHICKVCSTGIPGRNRDDMMFLHILELEQDI